MAITLDQIKGMNLQVGDRIELTIAERHPWSEMVYFQGLDHDGYCDLLRYDLETTGIQGTEPLSRKRAQPIPSIASVKKLKYED